MQGDAEVIAKAIRAALEALVIMMPDDQGDIYAGLYLASFDEAEAAARRKLKGRDHD